MGESLDDLAGVGGSFDLDGLKKKYRRQDAALKPRNTLAAIEREILEEIARTGALRRPPRPARDIARLRQIIEPAMARLPQDGFGDPEAYQALNADIVRYAELRAQAQRVQHYLIIHREAMGFGTTMTCSFYPIPAALTPLPPTHTLGLQSILELVRACWTMARAASSLVPSPVT
jgi:hypothetical protein